MTNKSDWKHLGFAGHFCLGDRCTFHLATVVGNKYLVSTVGAMLTNPTDKKYSPVGADSLYETMVFIVGAWIDEHTPVIDDYTEIDASRYNGYVEASDGHWNMCNKWSDIADKEMKDA